MESFLFWLFALLMLLGGVGVIVNRNPVASALSLVGVLIAIAFLYLQLRAPFLFAIQIIVGAGAVMVLFLFIIMLLDLRAEEARRVRPFGFLCGAAAGGFFAWEFFRMLAGNGEVGRTTTAALPAIGANDIPQMGSLLFERYVLPFEAVGILLLVAMIGVVLLSKKEMK